MIKTKVNMMVGRFQPFTLGHLKCVEQAYKTNGYPVVICMISNTKFDEKHPFSDELIEREMNDVLRNYKDYIIEIRRVTNGNISGIVHYLNERYEVQALVAGTDRVKTYRDAVDRARRNPLRNPFIDDFKIIEVKRSDEDISATKVREAIKNDDPDTFRKMMPRINIPLKVFRDELNKIRENYNINIYKNIYNIRKMKSIRDYIIESIVNTTDVECPIAHSLIREYNNTVGVFNNTTMRALDCGVMVITGSYLSTYMNRVDKGNIDTSDYIYNFINKYIGEYEIISFLNNCYRNAIIAENPKLRDICKCVADSIKDKDYIIVIPKMMIAKDETSKDEVVAKPSSDPSIM